MADELSSLLDSLPPEVLAELLNMGTLDERGQLLDSQLSTIQQQGQQQAPQRTTSGGAILSGLANAIRGVHTGMETAGIREKQGALLDRKDAGRSAYADAIRRFMQRPTVNEDGVELVPPPSF